MKKVLVLGAGQSAPFLIDYLLRNAQDLDLQITVGDLDVELAAERIGNHPRGAAVHFDVNDATLRSAMIGKADVVVNMLAPSFQELVAWDCVNQKTPMVSASYRSRGVRDLDRDAHRQGVLLLCEMGLDPGIDHMSAMSLITRLHAEEATITAFYSYGAGIPAPDQNHRPLRYAITWNPRNVVMSGEGGAQYMEDNRIKIVPYHHVFDHTWAVDVEGVGSLEAYPNRDSLSYMKAFGLNDVRTMIRGTLRYPGWGETWSAIVRLGLPNEALEIPGLAQRTYREVTEMFLPMTLEEPGTMVEERVARFLHLNPTGTIMNNLAWLGLFDDDPTGAVGNTAAAMMENLLRLKLPLGEDERDLVVLMHELDVERQNGSGLRRERITSTFTAEGEPGGFTAMSKAVGLPSAIAVKMILAGEIDLTGSQIPTRASIYEPVLRELRANGLEFNETVTEL